MSAASRLSPRPSRRRWRGDIEVRFLVRGSLDAMAFPQDFHRGRGCAPAAGMCAIWTVTSGASGRIFSRISSRAARPSGLVSRVRPEVYDNRHPPLVGARNTRRSFSAFSGLRTSTPNCRGCVSSPSGEARRGAFQLLQRVVLEQVEGAEPYEARGVARHLPRGVVVSPRDPAYSSSSVQSGKRSASPTGKPPTSTTAR